jgi:thioredoxin reductase (NADPH)
MSAAIYAGRKALSVLMLESKGVGGYLALAPWVENYPGVEKVSGLELAERMKKQLDYFKIKVTMGTVVGISRTKSGFKIKTADSEYESKTVILATGCHYSNLGIPGEKEFLGKGVSYCATCDGVFFTGKRVAIIGGGNTALSAAIMMCCIADQVYLVNRRAELRGDESLQNRLGKTKKFLGYVPTRILGDRFVTGLELEETKTKKKIVVPLDGVFINIGAVPTSDIAKAMGADINGTGNIKTECNGATNIPGLFAAGDVTGGIKQIIIAAAQGAMAATGAHDHIKYGKTVKEE